MDSAFGRGASPSLNGAKEVLLIVAPNPPSRCSISRDGIEDI